MEREDLLFLILACLLAAAAESIPTVRAYEYTGLRAACQARRGARPYCAVVADSI